MWNELVSLEISFNLTETEWKSVPFYFFLLNSKPNLSGALYLTYNQ